MKGSESLQARHRRVLLRALLVVGSMFCFGFALVPIYDVFCKVTGLNGKTQDRFVGVIDVPEGVERSVRVQFITQTNAGMPWEFRPVLREVSVAVGQPTDVEFYAANPTTINMVAQAVPSVSPSEGAAFLQKTECFCFQHQPLKAGEETHMKLRFFVDVNLPDHIHTLTLSYTLFDITDRDPKTKS